MHLFRAAFQQHGFVEVNRFGQHGTVGPGQAPAPGAAAALGYLDLRFAAEDWRPGRPALATWFEAVAKRRSLKETVPPA